MALLPCRCRSREPPVTASPSCISTARSPCSPCLGHARCQYHASSVVSTVSAPNHAPRNPSLQIQCICASCYPHPNPNPDSDADPRTDSNSIFESTESNQHSSLRCASAASGTSATRTSTTSRRCWPSTGARRRRTAWATRWLRTGRCPPATRTAIRRMRSTPRCECPDTALMGTPCSCTGDWGRLLPARRTRR